MERKAVVSKTGMTGYAYDAATKVLEIAFASRKPGEPDKVYHYAEFTAEDWAAFQAAESKGSHFLKVVKPKFKCTKIEPEKVVCGARDNCKNPRAEAHTCPFKREINNDNETLCTCCPDCQQECSDDI